MSKKSKDIARYVILALIGYFTYTMYHDIIDHVIKTEKLGTQSASVLGVVITNVSGIVILALGYFFKTKAS